MILIKQLFQWIKSKKFLHPQFTVTHFIIIFGVVIATEKKLPSILVDESSVSKHLLLVLLVLLCSLVEIQETLLFFFFFLRFFVCFLCELFGLALFCYFYWC